MPSWIELLMAIAVGSCVLLNIQQLALCCLEQLMNQNAMIKYSTITIE